MPAFSLDRSPLRSRGYYSDDHSRDMLPDSVGLRSRMRRPDFVAGLGSVAASCAGRNGVLVRQSSMTETIPIVFGMVATPSSLGS